MTKTPFLFDKMGVFIKRKPNGCSQKQMFTFFSLHPTLLKDDFPEKRRLGGEMEHIESWYAVILTEYGYRHHWFWLIFFVIYV